MSSAGGPPVPADPEAASQLARGRALVAMGRPGHALPLLGRAAALSPADPAPWCLMAACHLDLDQPGLALEAAEHAIWAAPVESWGHRVRALALAGLNRPADALAAAGEAVRIAPGNVLDLQVLAQSQARSGETALANQTVDRLRELAPGQPATWVTLSFVALKSRCPRDAARYALEALRLDPTNHSALNNLGVAYRRQFRFIRALQCFVQSWRLAPHTRIAKQNIAAVLVSLILLTGLATTQLASSGAGPAALLLPAAVAIAAWRGLRGLPRPAWGLVGREMAHLRTNRPARRRARRTTTPGAEPGRPRDG